MNHPEGRLVAIQQQVFFGTMLAQEMGLETEVILRKLALIGLRLVTDEQEITFDAAAVFPAISKIKDNHLQAVPDLDGQCDICENAYDLTDRTTRCGDCGDCGNCCKHTVGANK